MTYQEWRKFGYRSKLWRLRCGPSGSTINQENSIAQQQVSAAQQANQISQQEQQQMQTLEAPLIAQQTALASGDPNAVLTAALPNITPITKGYNAAVEQINNTLPPGAARDYATAETTRQGTTAVGQTESNLVANAPGILANIGQGLGTFSLQELGASLSGLQGGAATTNNVLQSQTQQQADKLGVAGDLVGAAGTAAGGYLSHH
jgi:hypothetical protein